MDALPVVETIGQAAVVIGIVWWRLSKLEAAIDRLDSRDESHATEHANLRYRVATIEGRLGGPTVVP